MSNALEQGDIDSLLHPFTNAAIHAKVGPLVIQRGEGIRVFDEKGKEYIEGIAGLWCTSLGFGQKELVAAAAEQMQQLSTYHLAMHRSTAPVIHLAEKLKQIAPGRFSKVFFVNSGSEANDTQVKLLWYYNNACGLSRKKKIISYRRGYHGSTIVAASLTGLHTAHRDFDLPIPQVRHITPPYYYREAYDGESEAEFLGRLVRELDQVIINEGPETIGALIAEPVMGAGGVLVPPEGYFEKVQEVLRMYDIRFICDEVICGFGRTGPMWGAQRFGIRAHSISCAKGLSSGYLPIGAVLVDELMYDAIREESERIGTFSHGFTFGGHPVPAAVALKTLELMEKLDVLGHVQRVAVDFQDRLARLAGHPLVGNTRAVGLLGAVELVSDKKNKRGFPPGQEAGVYCAKRCLNHGLIVRPLGDVLAFCPPLLICQCDVHEMFDRFEKGLADTEAWVSRERGAVSSR